MSMKVDIDPLSLINHAIQLHAKGWITKGALEEIIKNTLARLGDQNNEIKTQVTLFARSQGYNVD